MARLSLRTGSVVVCLAALVLFASTAGLGAFPAGQGVDRQLLLTVVDEAGAPMTGLKTDQFVVLEDGAMRTVTASRIADEPLSVVLLLDMTQPPYGQTLSVRDIRAAVSAFISTVHASQPDARIQLVEVAGAPTVRMKFSTETDKLLESAGRLFQAQQGDGPMVEAVLDAARDLRGEESLRHVIVAIDRDSPDPSRTLPEDLVRAIQAARASVWNISIRESGRGSPMREEMLRFLTQEFGGTVQTARVLTPLEGMLTKLAQALTNQYVITYSRPSGVTVTDVLAGTTTSGTVLMSEMAER